MSTTHEPVEPATDAAPAPAPAPVAEPTRSHPLCRTCGSILIDAPEPGFAGTRRFTCAACGTRTHAPLTRNWRIFWWAFAALTSVGVVVGNLMLLNDYSWIPGGVGLLSFVVLCTDIVLQRRTNPRGVAPAAVAVLSVLMTLVVVSSVLGALVVAGLNNAYAFDVVVQEEHAATTTQGYGSAMNVSRSPSWASSGGGTYLCGDGDDYNTCVNMHIAMYNSVCLGELTASGQATCSSLREFNASIKAQAADCGSGCTTRGDAQGNWGWTYVTVTPEEVEVPNRDFRPEITYTDHCDFSLGPIELGNCLPEGDPERE
ncbi:hypothetical protein ACGGZK_15420 [Agromyces sp. MMS24-K17]|uniref:hypothetical protein n=1 Tax=Agromyces sp. MMS24-K17 TaxID=3372850 RepID=UPI003754D0DB